MIVVGTAGHIDHGKTTLVRSLTGIETDRLQEEQQRGISIELGFAYLDLPDGTRLGLVDVPGHERFVHHMIAGATGVDLVILVVAADEGVMPQTKEHVAICELLGMKKGLVVLSKVDLVDEEWLELVRDDVADYLASTFLAGAPFLEFASTWEPDRMGQFKNSLNDVVLQLSSALTKESQARPFMMPVDRAFTIRGFGTVVTGTVQSGTIRAGDPVVVQPSGRTTRIRRLENHGQQTDEARAGTRTAINILDVQKGEIQRGNVLVSSPRVHPLFELTATLEAVPNLQVERKTQFKALFHTGSAMSEASVRLLDCPRLQAGTRAYVGIRLASPVSLMPGNRYILRAFSHVAEFGKTLGGGTILWPAGVKARQENLERLRKLESDSSADIVEALAFLSGMAGLDVNDMGYLSTVSDAEVEKCLAHDTAGSPPVHRFRVGGRPRLMHTSHVDRVSGLILHVVDGYHEANPRRPGITREELKSSLPHYLDREIVVAVIEHLVDSGLLAGDEMRVRKPGFEPRLEEDFVALLNRAETLLRRGGLSPPTRDALAEQLDLDDKEVVEVLSYMAESGRAVKVSSGLYCHSRTLAEARQRLVTFLEQNQTATTQQLKDLFAISRKYLIPLIEHFDASRVTVRIGTSQRKLRGR